MNELRRDICIIGAGIIDPAGVYANCLLKGIAACFLLCHKNPPIKLIKKLPLALKGGTLNIFYDRKGFLFTY